MSKLTKELDRFWTKAKAWLAAAAVDFDGVLSWRIPEGEVARVEVGGEVVWPIIPYVTNGLVAGPSRPRAAANLDLLDSLDALAVPAADEPNDFDPAEEAVE